MSVPSQSENCHAAIVMLELLSEKRRQRIQEVAIALRYIDDDLKTAFTIWTGLGHMATLAKIWITSPQNNPAIGLFLLSKWAAIDSPQRYKAFISLKVSSEMTKTFAKSELLIEDIAKAIMPFLQYSLAIVDVSGVPMWCQLADDGFDVTPTGNIGIRMGVAQIDISKVLRECVCALALHIDNRDNMARFTIAIQKPLFLQELVKAFEKLYPKMKVPKEAQEAVNCVDTNLDELQKMAEGLCIDGVKSRSNKQQKLVVTGVDEVD
jgi:hypothetical protein